MAKIAFGLALRDYASRELDAAIEALARREHVHAGVHQARRAIRCTRAALGLGEARLGAGSRSIDRALRKLSRELSVLRDAHALVEVLERLAERTHDPDDRKLLRRATRSARDGARRMKKDYAPERQVAGETLAVLRASLQGLPWEALDWPECQAVIDRSQERALAAQDRALDSHKGTRWHRWRRRVRLLVHERRACSECGAAAIPELRFEQFLGEQLGVAAELNLIVERCDDSSPFKPSQRKPLRKFAARAVRRQRERILSVLPRH